MARQHRHAAQAACTSYLVALTAIAIVLPGLAFVVASTPPPAWLVQECAAVMNAAAAGSVAGGRDPNSAATMLAATLHVQQAEVLAACQVAAGSVQSQINSFSDSIQLDMSQQETPQIQQQRRLTQETSKVPAAPKAQEQQASRRATLRPSTEPPAPPPLPPAPPR